MRLEELSSQSSYNDNILIEGNKYTVGTNDGREFRSFTYKGTKLLSGKPMMVFKTNGISKEQLTINPSFHTFTLEYNEGEENG